MDRFAYASRRLLAASLLSLLCLIPARASAASWEDVRATVAMRGLATDGSTYVAASANGIWTSTDLVTWNKATLPAGAGMIYNDVMWDGSRFIAVGMGIINSPDGVNWSLRVKPTGTRFFWNSIVLAGGIYVVVGNDATDVLRSTDGVHWTQEPTGLSNTSSGGFELTGVASDGTAFIASGNKYQYLNTSVSPEQDVMLSSPDGVTWTQQALPSSGNANYDESLLSDASFGAGIYLVGNVGGYYTSPDGSTWSDDPQDLGTDVPLAARTSFVNGHFVAAGIDFGTSENSAVFTSTDGTHWGTHKLQPRGASIYGMSSVLFNGGQYIVGGYQGIYTSSDASTWTKKFTGPQTNFAGCVITGGGKIVIPGYYGAMSSTDSSTWPAALDSSSTLFASLGGRGCGAYGAGVFVAVADAGQGIAWSSDGVTWTDVRNVASITLSGVTWTGSQFVAIGTTTPSNASMLISKDGKTWTFFGGAVTPSGTVVKLGEGTAALAYLNNRLVTWGSIDGKAFVSTSSDGGGNWSTVTTGLGAATGIASVAYGDGMYLAIGNDASEGTRVFTSADAKTWTAVSGVASGKKTRWNSAMWGNGEFMVVGGDGVTNAAAFLTSSDGKTWTYSSTDSAVQVSDVAWDGAQYIAAADYDVLRKQEAAVGGGGGGGGGAGGGSSSGGGGGTLGLGIFALLSGLGLMRRRLRA